MTRPSFVAAFFAAALFCGPSAVHADEADAEPNPEAEEAFFLGNGLLSEGDPTGALEAYDEALALDPNFYRVHLYRGRAFLALNNTDLAREAAGLYGKASLGAEEREDLKNFLAQVDAVEKAAEEAASAPSSSDPDESTAVVQATGRATGSSTLDVALGVSAAFAIGGWAATGVSGAALAGRRATAFDQTVAYGEREQAQRDGEVLAPVVVGAVIVGGVASAVTAALGISKATGGAQVAVGLGPTLGPGLSITFVEAPPRSRIR